MVHRFVLNETSYHGAGAIGEIVGEARRRGFRKALVVTDPDLVQFKVAAKVTDLLAAAKLPYAVYDRVKANPAVSTVQDGVDAFKAAGADYLIAIGGGSAIDTGKAIGIVISNPQYADVVSLEGPVPTPRKAVPMFAVPTTAGTAAETTINYVITDPDKRRKFVCVDPHDIPVVAVVDPDMMASMPKSLAAATGMDALTHAIEGYSTPGAWELSDTLNIKAVELIARSLRGALARDPQAQADMALGQYVTGMAYSNVGLGLVHGMSHPLSAFYDTPHGVANAVLLPYVLVFNAPATGERFRDIGRAMKVPGIDGMGLDAARAAMIDAVGRLRADVGIPRTLKDLNVKEDDLDALTEAALADVCTGGNPRPVDHASVVALYRTAFHGK